MQKNSSSSPLDYIFPLEIDNLSGRVLEVPANNDKLRNILLVYGHHGMLERWWGLVENLCDYGSVTMPDLPGFGGMDSFSKVGIKPDIDAYADYLADFIMNRFKGQPITVIAISFGFVVVTRMLQRHPDLSQQLEILVSLVGFMHKDDFVYAKLERQFYAGATRTFATRPIAFFIRYVALNRFALKFLYTYLPNSRKRMKTISAQEFNDTMKYEVKLWQSNDVRTHWLTTSEFLRLNNCKSSIHLPVIHITTQEDGYFNNEVVKKHMLDVFDSYSSFMSSNKEHTPSVLADKEAAGVMLPDGLRKLLSK